MKISQISFLSFLIVAGCASSDTASTSTLDASSESLIADSDEMVDQDDQIEGVEDGTSSGNGAGLRTADAELGLLDADAGLSANDGPDPDPQAAPVDAAEQSRSNAGRYFKPAGCIVSTRVDNVVTHVFTNCTGPNGSKTLNGTIKATWSRPASGGLQVVREAKGFSINGATIDRTATVVFTREGTVFTKTRTVTDSGTTAKGNAFTRQANWVVKYDAAAKCIYRDGAADGETAKRTHSVVVSGFKRCGVGFAGCPEAGTITISATKGDKSKSVTITYSPSDATIAAGGRSFSRKRTCGS